MFVLGFSHLSKYWTFKNHLSAKECKAESKLRLVQAGTSPQHSVVLSMQSTLGPEFAFMWHRAWAGASCLSAQLVSSGSVPNWRGYTTPGSGAISMLFSPCCISRRITPINQMLHLLHICFWKSCLFHLYMYTSPSWKFGRLFPYSDGKQTLRPGSSTWKNIKQPFPYLFPCSLCQVGFLLPTQPLLLGQRNASTALDHRKCGSQFCWH